MLQNFETGLYVSENGSWTADPATARRFDSEIGATDYRIRLRLNDTFVVLLPEVPRAAGVAAAQN